MPLVRFPVRNEYGLGRPELYGEAERDDPKALLQGVAVAGLVGILRQLGDLAEFAAEVFHGLQEEVTNTCSRSRKMMARVQRIEAALPSLEKSMLAQKSHIHFAYTSASVWHPHARIKQNLLIRSDLPQFIMDSYEECSDPPRLHVLDKFDSGGPGSCLKRYSDPTFFKKASLSNEQLNGDKLSKSGKNYKSKKKRSRQRSLSSRDPSVSTRTDRPRFSSLQAGVGISLSPSETVTTTKSDEKKQPDDYDLRTDSSYIECVFTPTSPIKPEEHEPEHVSTSSSQNLPDNSTFNLASVDESTRDTDDDYYEQSPLQEQIRGSSSSVSWEEKAEIVEPNVHQHEHVEAAEILETDFDRDAEEKGEFNSDNVGELEFSVENGGGLFTFVASQIQPDDVDSEPDNFMDALNNIESESEIDTNFQTKHEVERSLSLNSDRAIDEVHEQTTLHSDDLPSKEIKQEMKHFNFVVDNSDSRCSAAHTASYQEPIFDNVFSSQLPEPDEIPKTTEESCNTGIFVNNNIVESVNAEALSNLISNEVAQNESRECKTNYEEISGVQPVQFWTNGGLLGLEPSKPPVFGVPNTVSEGSVANENVVQSSLAQVNVVNVVKGAQSSEIVERNSSKCSTSYLDNSNMVSDKKTSWRFLSAILDTKREKEGYFQLSNSFNNNLAHSFGKINGIIPNNEEKISGERRALCNEASQDDVSNGSHISVLSNRIPLNDFQRSLVHSKGLDYRALDDRTFKGYNESGYIMHSPSSSPPLQHMKISFQPENHSSASKLKLKFPESDTYMLPSFQLVPEPNSSHHDNGSDSDDDTFCRSSPYMSDDRHGNESESDSEQWDSDYNPQNGVRNMSIKESVLSSTETEENRLDNVDADYGFQCCLEPSQVNISPDLPSLSAMNPLFEQEMKILSDANNFSNLHTPQPPPLPPSEWRNIKPNSNVTIAKQETNVEKIHYENDLNLCSTIVPQSNLNSGKKQILGSTITPQTNPSSVPKNLETKVALAIPPTRELERRKSTGQNEASQIRKGMVFDEKDDFLNQIRAKSFNLRRTGTVTEKPNVTAGLATNARVTAILEKANAIRQAVGSDDGEDDDSWSEA